jgi:ABC-2 type transport system permease protein
MPVRRRGYHRWGGRLRSALWAWRAILGNGIRLCMKQKKASMFAWSGVPLALSVAVLLYFVAQAAEAASQFAKQGLPQQFSLVLAFIGVDARGLANEGALGELVVPIWTLVFDRLCVIQGVLILVIHAKFSSDLISSDLRTNALPIYFSKPVTPATYLLGKWMVAMSFALLVTLLPNLIAMAAGVLLTDVGDQWANAARLFGGIIIQSVLIAGLSSLIMLALSSLTRDWRLVAGAWFGAILLPDVSQVVLDEYTSGAVAGGLLGAISPRRNFARLTYWLLDADGAVESVGQAAGPGAADAFANAVNVDTLSKGLGWSVAVLAAMAVVALVVSIVRVRRFQIAVANA